MQSSYYGASGFKGTAWADLQAGCIHPGQKQITDMHLYFLAELDGTDMDQQELACLLQ